MKLHRLALVNDDIKKNKYFFLSSYDFINEKQSKCYENLNYELFFIDRNNVFSIELASGIIINYISHRI